MVEGVGKGRIDPAIAFVLSASNEVEISQENPRPRDRVADIFEVLEEGEGEGVVRRAIHVGD